MSKNLLSDFLKIGLLLLIIYIETLSTCSNKSVKDLLSQTRQDVKHSGQQVRSAIDDLNSASVELAEARVALATLQENNRKTRQLIEGIDKKYLTTKTDAQLKLKEIYSNLDITFQTVNTGD